MRQQNLRSFLYILNRRQWAKKPYHATVPLKVFGFWGFCINRFGLGPLHYVSSRSDLSFKFSEIFIIEKTTWWVGESTRWSIDTMFQKPTPRLPDSPTHRVVFRLRISSRIQNQNRSGSKCSVRDICRTDLCIIPRKSASLPCPFKCNVK
jgi:hypothetical protein